jgi:GAF domain-containing protein
MARRPELALPLISRGQVLGAMTVQSNEAAAFGEQDIAILQTMSDQVATAIANAQLFEQAALARRQSEARLRETQFLQRVGQAVSSSLDLSSVLDVVMDTLQRELGFTHNALALVDQRAETVSIPRASGTAAGLQGLTRSSEQLQNDIIMDVLRTGQIEVIDGWDDRFDREIYDSQGHAELVRAFVPLRLRGESIGLLEVGYRRAERAHITPEEVRLLGGLADQIAIAVGNARLLTRLSAASPNFKLCMTLARCWLLVWTLIKFCRKFITASHVCWILPTSTSACIRRNRIVYHFR